MHTMGADRAPGPVGRALAADRIVERIGAGGMGEVYRAGRAVARKVS
jgi:hypothetical protein